MSIKVKKHQKRTMEEKLNTLRAGALGSNDGISIVVGVLVSVTVATSNRFTIFIVDLSDLLARTFSMASGEYAFVSIQKDTEKAVVTKEEQLLKDDYEGEFAVVKNYYVNRGVTPEISIRTTKDLLNKKPLEIVVRIGYDVELGHYPNPWDAALSSLFSATAGGLVPSMAMTFAPEAYKRYAVILAAAFMSALTGYINSKPGNGLVKIAVIRNIIIGLITITTHYGVGKLF